MEFSINLIEFVSLLLNRQRIPVAGIIARVVDGEGSKDR